MLVDQSERHRTVLQPEDAAETEALQKVHEVAATSDEVTAWYSLALQQYPALDPDLQQQYRPAEKALVIRDGGTHS